MEDALEGLDVALVRADNPGMLTLTGTNTWLLGRDPCWVVDPGPLLEAHLDAVLAEGERRGGIGGIALTHDHHDHADALPELVARAGVSVVAAARHPGATVRPADGDTVGPLRVFAVPGHAPDLLCFGFGTACCTGDAVLGQGSVFISDDLTGYLKGLAALRTAGFRVLLPGHGPPATEASAHIAQYIAHRLERERKLVHALGEGRRTVEDLLDAAWAEVPAALRPAAAVTLGAHLDRLELEGRLPDGVERPRWDGTLAEV